MDWSEPCRTTRCAERSGRGCATRQVRAWTALRQCVQAIQSGGTARSQASQRCLVSHGPQRCRAVGLSSGESEDAHLWIPLWQTFFRKLGFAWMLLSRPPNRLLAAVTIVDGVLANLDELDRRCSSMHTYEREWTNLQSNTPTLCF